MFSPFFENSFISCFCLRSPWITYDFFNLIWEFCCSKGFPDNRTVSSRNCGNRGCSFFLLKVVLAFFMLLVISLDGLSEPVSSKETGSVLVTKVQSWFLFNGLWWFLKSTSQSSQMEGKHKLFHFCRKC